MFVKKIKISNFKSFYGVHEFDFESMKGINCLKGNIGSGKTTICDAIIYGLYGCVDGVNIPALVSWGEKDMSVEISLRTKDYDIVIQRNNRKPAEIYVNGDLMMFTNKKDAQQILETEYYDIPKMVVTRLYLLTFGNFDKSICKMTAGKLREFSDEVFNMSIFTAYKDIFTQERSEIKSECTTLETTINILHNETESIKNQIEKTKTKNQAFIVDLLNQSKQFQKGLNDIEGEIKLKNEKINELKKSISDYQNKINETNAPLNSTLNDLISLYKESLKKYNNIKSGVCPTCGSKIESQEVEKLKSHIDDLIVRGRNTKDSLKQIECDQKVILNKYNTELDQAAEDYAKMISERDHLKMKLAINKQEIQIHSKQESESTLNEYLTRNRKRIDELIKQLNQLNERSEQIDQLYNLFYLDLRERYLDSIVLIISNTVNKILQQLGTPFSVSINNSFCVSFINSNNEMFSYGNLSTGQKKTIDVVLILSLIDLFSQSEFNILFLDELFSNMDQSSRDNLLALIYNMFAESTVFVVSHNDFDNSLISSTIKISNNNGESEVTMIKV
jgi:DNA repair exonuclease SbcCD ATPase subunit